MRRSSVTGAFPVATLAHAAKLGERNEAMKSVGILFSVAAAVRRVRP